MAGGIVARKLKTILVAIGYSFIMSVAYIVLFVGLLVSSILFVQFLHLILMGKWN